MTEQRTGQGNLFAYLFEGCSYVMFDHITNLAIDDDQDTLYSLRQICQYQKWKTLLACSYP